MHEDALDPGGPVPPSMLWDGGGLDARQSLEAHCQTLLDTPNTDQKSRAKSESPGSHERAWGATATVGVLWATRFMLKFCDWLASRWTSVRVTVTGHWARRNI